MDIDLNQTGSDARDHLVQSLCEAGLSDRQLDGVASTLNADGNVGHDGSFGPNVSAWPFRFRPKKRLRWWRQS